MNGSRDLKGVQDCLKFVGFGVSQASRSPKISAKRLGAVAQDEVALRVCGVFPLSIGIEREDRCE